MSERLVLYPISEERFKAGDLIALYQLEMPCSYRVLGQIVPMGYRHEDDPEIPEKPVIESQQLPVGTYLSRPGDEEETRVDGRGTELRFIFARELAVIDWHGEDQKGFGKAVAAFIRNLPEWTPIVLYRC